MTRRPAYPPGRSQLFESFDEAQRRRLAYVVADGWYQENVPAAQSATEAIRAVGRWRAIRVGSVIGLIVEMRTGQARTAGSLTVEAYRAVVNPSSGARTESAMGLKAILNATHPVYHAVEQESNKDKFYPGDELYVKVTTDGSWAPTTGDIEMAILLEM